MTQYINIDGRRYRVLNRLSSGPAEPTHTDELPNGAYVYQIGRTWWLQERRQVKRSVTLDSAVTTSS